MDERSLKKQLEQYVSENGTKYRHIADKVGISESMLCHWRKDRRNLSVKHQERLKDYIRG